MKELVKNTSIMGVTKILTIVIGIVRNKYLAVTIGAEGFGIYNLLLSFFHLGDILAGTSMGGATLKYMAEYNSRGERDNVEATFNMSFFIVFVLVSLLTIVFIIFFPFFKHRFLSPEVAFSHYALFAISYFFSIIGGVFEAGVKGLIKIKDLARRSIISSVIGLISLFVCVYFWGLNGFFLNLVIVAFLGALVLYHALSKSITIRIRMPDFRSKLFKKIFKFSFIDMFTNITMVGGNFLRRRFVVSAMSISSLGLYSAASSFSNHFSIVGNSAQSYMFPKMSEDLSIESRDKVFSDYIRLVSIGMGILCPIVVLFGKQFIALLYSPEFLPISSTLFWFMVSITIASIQHCYLWTIYGMAHLKIFSYVIIGSDMLSIILAWALLPKLGIIALPVVASISSIMRIIVWAIFLHRLQGIWLGLKNIKYPVMAVALIIFAGFGVNLTLVYKILGSIAVCIIFGLSIKKDEYLSMIKSARDFLRTKRRKKSDS